MVDLVTQFESFRFRYPFDDDAYNYIINSDPEVQTEILRDFKPKREGEQDYSALIIGFTKRRRQSVKERQLSRAMPPNPVTNAPFEASLSPEEVEAFRAQYPCDEDAMRYIVNSPPQVQRQIFETFKPPREGEQDYSALIITFSKKCRANALQPQYPQQYMQQYAQYGPQYGQYGQQYGHYGQPQYAQALAGQYQGAQDQTGAWHWGAGGYGGAYDDGYEAFRARYPFDEDTHSYLQKSPPEVRQQVLENFKPPREGEADYSALLITFCKKMRENSQRMQLHLPQPDYGADYSSMAHASFQAMQQGAFNQAPPARPSQVSQASFSFDSAYNYALEAFRQRYPMDDRCFDFLKNAAPEIQQEVVEKFSPQRQDTDYSALIISFAKKLREREQAAMQAKRPRLV